MDHYLAEIRPFTGTKVPQDWHLCDGTLLPIAGNEALYSLLGTAFGGNGQYNFAVPDLRSRLPIGSGQGAGLTARAYASNGGNESVALGTGQIPAHNHAFTVTTDSATSSSPSGNLFANPNPNNFYGTTPNQGSAPQVLNADTVPLSGGSGQGHENRMPTMAVNYIIATVGIFPVKP
jgi:microcystin-dependent protein